MRLVLVVAALAGCNQVFGLEQTVPGVPCWQTAQSEFDEDSDGIVDGCDICPAVADPRQDDGDDDGVGDACDPHADRVDRIAFFDGFTLPAIDARWTSFGVGVMWAQRDGALHQTVVGENGTLILQETFDNATVEIVVSGQEQRDPTMYTGQGMVLRIVPGDEREYPVSVHCFSYFEPNSPAKRRILVVEDQPDQAIKDGTLMMHGARTLLRGTSAGACSARVDDHPLVATMLTVELPPVLAKVALRVTHTIGAFHSITVYETAL